MEKRHRWVDPNQLELCAPVAPVTKGDAQPQKNAGDVSRSRERIHLMWIMCVIVVCVPVVQGIVPQLFHLDVAPVREAAGSILALFSPVITLIASSYFNRSER